MSAPDVKAPGTAAGVAGQAQGTDGTETVDHQSNERKAVANAAAMAARGGCCLHELASGGFLLTRWAYCRELPDVRAVLTLLSQMGVR